MASFTSSGNQSPHSSIESQEKLNFDLNLPLDKDVVSDSDSNLPQDEVVEHVAKPDYDTNLNLKVKHDFDLNKFHMEIGDPDKDEDEEANKVLVIMLNILCPLAHWTLLKSS